MSLSKQQRKEIARKAVRTREQREKKRERVERAHKAVETTEKSEKGYIPNLARLLGVNRKNIFHHVGLPDLLVIGNRGEISFYEIKPQEGGPNKRLLNRYQKETVKRLLNLGFGNIYIVRYGKHGKTIRYGKPIQLSAENLNEYCL